MKEQEKLLEKIAIGDIGVEGSYEIKIINDSTGRVHQYEKGVNHVFPNIHSPLRYAAISMLTALPVTPNYVWPSLFSVPTAELMNACNMFARICLTNGTRPANEIDPEMGIDGVIIGEGDNRWYVPDATIFGRAPTWEWRATSNMIRKEWVWELNNGNGTFSKIVTTNNNRRDILAFNNVGVGSLDLFVRHDPSHPGHPPGTTIVAAGGDSPHNWFSSVEFPPWYD